MVRVAVVLVVAAAVLAAAAPRAGAADRRCGRAGGMRIVVEHGRVACATARVVAVRFARTAVAPRGWICFRGHGADAWAVACSRRNVIVRGY